MIVFSVAKLRLVPLFKLLLSVVIVPVFERDVVKPNTAPNPENCCGKLKTLLEDIDIALPNSLNKDIFSSKVVTLSEKSVSACGIRNC